MKKILVVLVVLLGLASSVSAQGRHARKQAERSAALKELQQLPQEAGTRIQVNASLQEVYESLATMANRKDLQVDRDNSGVNEGMFVTNVFDIEDGRITDKGKRIRVVLMKDAPNTTTLRVAVEDVSIKPMMSGASWKGSVNDPASAALAQEISALFTASSHPPAVAVTSKVETTPVVQAAALTAQPVSDVTASLRTDESGATKFVAPGTVADAWDTVVSWVKSTYGREGLDEELTQRDALEIGTSILKENEENGTRTLVSLERTLSGTGITVTVQDLRRKTMKFVKKPLPWAMAEKKVNPEKSQGSATELAKAFGIPVATNTVASK